MSIKYMQRVWTTTELKGGALLVMLALADHANDAGECWPSQKHLAEKARLDERQVRRVIGTLAGAGYLTIKDRIADHGRKVKYILFPADTKPVDDEQKADKMSENVPDILSGDGEKADKMSEEKRTFCPPDILSTGHLQHPKADISDTNYSHARSESPIEPAEGNGIIPSSGLYEVSEIAEKWATVLAELLPTVPGVAKVYLAGSYAVDTGNRSTDGKRIYRVVIEERSAVGVGWLRAQVQSGLRRKLSTILKEPIEIEIVAAQPAPAQPEPAPEPQP